MNIYVDSSSDGNLCIWSVYEEGMSTPMAGGSRGGAEEGQYKALIGALYYGVQSNKPIVNIFTASRELVDAVNDSKVVVGSRLIQLHSVAAILLDMINDIGVARVEWIDPYRLEHEIFTNSDLFSGVEDALRFVQGETAVPGRWYTDEEADALAEEAAYDSRILYNLRNEWEPHA